MNSHESTSANKRYFSASNKRRTFRRIHMVNETSENQTYILNSKK